MSPENNKVMIAFAVGLAIGGVLGYMFFAIRIMWAVYR